MKGNSSREPDLGQASRSVRPFHWQVASLPRIVVIAFCSLVFVQTLLDFVACSNHVGGDFVLRYNEVECLKSGVNPFDVWSGRVDNKTYKGLGREAKAGQTKTVHAYPPWEYTCFLPLSIFSVRTAARLFFLCQVVALFVAIRFLFSTGHLARGRPLDGVFVTACGLFLGAAVCATLRRGQYSLLNVALLVFMFKALDGNRQILAGICWALLMSKPQIAVLFFVPLLLGRQFVAIGTAVVTCCLATLPAAALCHASPINMILSLRESGGNVLGSTTLLPVPLFSFLATHVHPVFPGVASAVIGLSLCTLFSWRFRNASSWVLRCLPAVLCSTAWTYSHLYDKVLLLVVQAVLALCILRSKKRKRTVLLFSLLLLSSFSLGYYIHPKTDSWFLNLGLTISSRLVGQCLYGLYVIGSFLQFLGFAAFLWSLSGRRSDFAPPQCLPVIRPPDFRQ